jgi:hypothetical protein
MAAAQAERGVSRGHVALLVATVVLLAYVAAAERGERLGLQQLLGVLMPLALLAGFVGLYLREQRRHPEWDDEDDRKYILGRVVIKLGCLLLVVASLSSLMFLLILGR